MVRYYGRAKTRTGSVNTKQLGLKMSGCPSRVGRNPVNARYISQRVACNRGICGQVYIHEAIPWRTTLNNRDPFCQPASSKCLQAAGGVGRIYTPYYRTNAPGEYGCGVTHTSHEFTILVLTQDFSSASSAQAVATEITGAAAGQAHVGKQVVVKGSSGKKVASGYSTSTFIQKIETAAGVAVYRVKHFLLTAETKAKKKIEDAIKGGEEFILEVENGIKKVEEIKDDLEDRKSKIGHELKEAKQITGKFKAAKDDLMKIVTGSKAVFGKSSEIKNELTSIYNKVKGFVTGQAVKDAQQTLESLSHINQTAHDIVATLATKIAHAKNLGETIETGISKLTTKAASILTNIENAGKKQVDNLKNEVAAGAKTANQAISRFVDNAKNNFIKTLASKKTAFISEAENVLKSFAKGSSILSIITDHIHNALCAFHVTIPLINKKISLCP